MHTKFYHTWPYVTLGGLTPPPAAQEPQFDRAAQPTRLLSCFHSLPVAARGWAIALIGWLWLGLSLTATAQVPDGVTVAGGLPSALNQLSSPAGVAVDKDGNVYVADLGNHRIVKWAPNASAGTTVAGGSGAGSGLNQLYYPSGVAVDKDGNVYVADLGNQRIVKWAPNASAGTIVAGGSGAGSGLNQLYDPFGVYVDGSGNVYVADTGNQRIVKWAPGASQGTIVAGGSGAGSGLNQLANPTGVYVDGAGNVYVVDQQNHRIVKWAPNASAGTIVAGGSGAGSGLNQLDSPTGVYVDGSGNVYVADQQNHRIVKWAPNASAGTIVAGGSGAGSRQNQLYYPFGVYVDGSGNVYVADQQNNRIVKWAPGASQGTLVAGGIRLYPAGVAVDKDGNVYVADEQNHRIVKWAPGASQGTIVAGGNGYGSGLNQLTYPYGVAVDKDGNVYVADLGNHRIVKWVPNASAGTIVAGGNGYGSGLNQLANPTGVYVDKDGNVYVADQYNHRIVKWAPGASQGTIVAGGSGAGSGLNQLYYPFGVYVDGSGNVYVADQQNHRIVKWAPGASQGAPVAGGSGAGSGLNQLYYPFGVYVDGSGNVYVADQYNHRIVKWAPGASQGAPVAGGNGYGAGLNQLYYPIGVAVDKDGNVYVADYNNNRVQKFAPLSSPPTLTGPLATPNPVCAGQPITFTATVGNVTQGYSYTLTNGAGSSLEGTASTTPFSQSLTARGQGSQTYTLTITTTEGTVSTTIPVTVNALPTPAITNLASSFCKDAQPVTLVGTPTEGGVFSIDGNNATQLNPANLTVGTHTVRYTVTANGCSNYIEQSVEIKAVPTPAITGIAIGSFFCQRAGLTVNLADVATPSGGSFTIDGQNATELIPANLAVGTHTLRYTVNANGCSAYAELAVEIRAQPTSAITGLANSFCKDASAVTLTGTPAEGGVFTIDGQSATQLNPANLSVGTHTVRYTVTANGCSNYSEQNVEIKAQPSAQIANLSSSFCKDAQPVTLVGTPSEGGTFTIDGQNATQLNPANLTLGTHIVRYTVTTNGCSAYTEQSVEIKAVPTPDIKRLANAYCQDAQPVSLTGTPTGGTFTIDGQSTTQLDPASLSAGNHTVRYTVTNNSGCSAFAEQVVEIKAQPTPAITNLADTYCKDAQAVTLTGTPTEGGVFTVDGETATLFSPTSLSVGNHTVRYRVTTNGCSATARQSVEIKALPTPEIRRLAAAYCQDAQPVSLTGAPTGGTFTIDGNNATQLDPASLSAGTHTVRYTVTNNSGCSAFVEQVVEIKALPTPAITGLANTYCKDAQAVALTGTPTEGGVFTVDGETATLFNPTSLSVGNHTVRYRVTTNGCSATARQTVEIKALPTPAITGLVSAYCKDAQPVTLAGTPAEGGVFTIDGQNVTQLNPANLTVGTHTIRYTVTTNGCSAYTEQSVEIKAVPTPQITGLANAFCKDAQPVTLAGTPIEGGVFTIDGNNATQLNPANLTVGNHTVRYTVTTNGCSGYSEQTVEIKALPTPAITSLANAFCKDAQPVTLAGTPTEGGVFSIDGQNATQLNPANLTVGNHTVRYMVTTNGCSAYTEQSVEIRAVPTPQITGLAPAFCKDASAVTLAGTPAEGGVFTIDGQNATQLNPANLSVGNHTVRYTVTTNGCSAFTEQVVEIKALPTVQITSLASAFCKDAQPVTLAGSPSGGNFTIDGQNATQLNPANLSVGNHMVRYTLTSNGCSNYAEQSVEIKALPTPNLSFSGPVSFTNSTVSLMATGGTTYRFSSEASQQGSGPVATVKAAGVYSVTATTNGCSATVSTTVTGGNSPTVCRGGTTLINVVVDGNPAKYEWYKNTLTSPKIMETPQLFRGTATSSLTLINAQANTQGDFYLKVTDRSNTVKVFGPFRLTVDANCRAREIASLEIPLQVELAPNPIQQDRLRAVVRGAEGRSLQVELVDLQGHSVRQQHWPQAQAEQVIEWQMQAQPSGVYLLQVVSGADAATPVQRQSVKVLKP
ncbi:SBBP repeat-containing protein [Spirosoma fluminis]